MSIQMILTVLYLAATAAIALFVANWMIKVIQLKKEQNEILRQLLERLNKS